MNGDFIKGLEISGMGLMGVFGVLILFYIIVLLLGRIKPREEE